MKKITLILVTIMIMFVLTGCGKKADTPKAIMEESFNLFDTYIADMNKTDDVDGAIAALEKFATKMETLKPRMKALEEKYPEMKDMFKGGNVPDEFKEFEGRMKELGPKMMALGAKMMKFMQDPKFQEAYKKFNEAMQMQ
ncbi:MAG: hypothetical protein ABFR75_02370 [Acidobacteriota bacterium]